MPFRFLHLADLHLETSFGGAPETRERLRRATLDAFERAVDHALEQRLHAVLVAGDLYDDPLLSPRVELELVRQVRRLAEAGIWFLAATGNHDPGGPGFRAARLGLERGAGWRERVHLFRSAAPERVTVRDPSGLPVGVVVGAGHASPTDGANLVAEFPAVASPLPVVGLVHSHVVGAREAEAHDRYAPSQAADYERLRYAYWALGHIHVRQRALPGLPVFYAGNLQGRNPREPGPKGGLLVEAHAGGFAEPEFVRFGPVRWERCRVRDLAGAVRVDALVERLARAVDGLRDWPGEELIAVLELEGVTPFASMLRRGDRREELRDEVRTRTAALEVQLRVGATSLPPDRGLLREAPTPYAHALGLMERAAAEPELLAALAPDALAARDAEEPAARLAYLRALLSDLPDELLERSRGEP